MFSEELTEAMPSRKQPATLQDMAMDILVGFYTQYCQDCSFEYSVDELHQGAVFIRTNIGSQMPRKIAAEFDNRFLKTLSRPPWEPGLIIPSSHLRIVLEVLMDQKVVRLKCSSAILAAFHPEDVHRLRGLIQERV